MQQALIVGMGGSSKRRSLKPRQQRSQRHAIRYVLEEDHFLLNSCPHRQRATKWDEERGLWDRYSAAVKL